MFPLWADGEAGWWATGAVAVLGAVTTLLVKFWPQLTRSREARSNSQLKADLQTAKLAAAAHEQVFAEYRSMIAQAAARTDAMALAAEKMQVQLSAVISENARCEERCRILEARVRELEAQVTRLQTRGAS